MFIKPKREEFVNAVEHIAGDDWKNLSTKKDYIANAIMFREVEYAFKKKNFMNRFNPLTHPFPFPDIKTYIFYIWGENIEEYND